jgi:hypothetical protein
MSRLGKTLRTSPRTLRSASKSILFLWIKKFRNWKKVMMHLHGVRRLCTTFNLTATKRYTLRMRCRVHWSDSERRCFAPPNGSTYWSRWARAHLRSPTATANLWSSPTARLRKTRLLSWRTLWWNSPSKTIIQPSKASYLKKLGWPRAVKFFWKFPIKSLIDFL